MTLFIITSFIRQSDSFYQVNAVKEIVPTIPVACIFSQNTKVGTTEWYNIWNITTDKVLAGNAFTIMSEEAIEIKSETEERVMLEMAYNIAIQKTIEKEVYIGVSYMKWLTGDTLATNMFALISSNQPDAASPIWKYQKSHPVPLIESNVKPGPGILPFHDSSYGKLSGGICFDLDYPDLIAQAGRNKVDCK